MAFEREHKYMIKYTYTSIEEGALNTTIADFVYGSTEGIARTNAKQFEKELLEDMNKKGLILIGKILITKA